jgi:hypothetical protein
MTGEQGWREGLIDSWRYQGLSGFIRLFKESAKLRRNRRRFKAVADPDKVIWVRPEDIVYKANINRSLRCSDIKSGDWDLERLELDRSAKHKAMVQHFKQGVEWEDTDLFKSIYAVRFARGESVHDAQSLVEMKLVYQKRYDSMFESLRCHGFLFKADDKGLPVKLPHVHIGRDGELLYGRDGNHRLAMAKILAIGQIPCLVYVRHVLWQEVRDLLATTGEQACRTKYRLWPHPDLADLSTLSTLSTQISLNDGDV